MSVKEAMMSPGYRKFKRMFKTECRKCGGKSCITVVVPDPGLFLKRFDRARIGFACLKCDKSWYHAYTIGKIFQEIKKAERLKEK